VPFRILDAPLRVLRRIYGPAGQLQAPLDIEYGLPIQPVHDVSREAELGTFDGSFGGLVSGRSPFFCVNVDNVHVGAGTVQLLLGIYSNQAPTWALASWSPPDPRLETIWILRVATSSLNGLLSGADVTNEMSPKAGAGSGLAPRMIIYRATANGQIATDGQQAGVVSSGTPRDLALPIPVSNKLLNNSPIEFVSSVSGADTIDLFIWCLRLPNGVMPPGMR